MSRKTPVVNSTLNNPAIAINAIPVTQFRSLNHKLLLSISSIVLVLALATAVVSFYMGFERAQSRTETMLNQLLDALEDTASIAAYSRNQKIAANVIKGLLKNDSVQYAKIASDGGFTLEKSKKGTVAEKAISRFLYSPFDDNQKIGFIVVQSSAEYNLAEAQYSALLNIATSISLIAFTAFIILLNIRTNFSKPLTDVSNSLHAIITDEEKRLQVFQDHQNDELGRLVNDINNLLSSLEDLLNQEQQPRQQVETIEQQSQHIFNSTSAGLFLLDEQGKLLTYNTKLTKILNISDINQHLLADDFFIAACFNEKNQFEALLQRALQSGQLENQDFSFMQNQHARKTWYHCLVSRVIDTHNRTCFEGVLFDVTDRIEHERALKHEAAHDPLTRLLCREAAQIAFTQYLSATREPNISFIVMDLDGFKQANDTYGHLAGDKVLSITAERLKRCVRSTDIVSRLGGDEFLIIMLNCILADFTFETAEKIIHAIQKPMEIDKDTRIQVSISVGIASYKPGRETFETLIQAADQALYAVKKQGKNGYCINDDELMNAILIRTVLPTVTQPTSPN